MSITAVYELRGDPATARGRAESLAVEQSHEFPPELAPTSAARSRAQVREIRTTGADVATATIDFPDELAGGELGQLLVLAFGNCALLPGVRLLDLAVPEEVADAIGAGPGLGIGGVRRVLRVPRRPLLATALKPVGLDSQGLAAMAYELAVGGVDIIKDDQGIGNQAWAPFNERVPRIAEAVRRANTDSGGNTRYLPCFTPPIGAIESRLKLAVDNGAGGLLLVPGTGSLELMRYVARSTPDDFLLLAHPAFLGGLAVSPTAGIAPELLYGPLLRLAGADAIIFPSYGGRFSFSEAECRRIADGCRREFANLHAALPTPGGGMSVGRVTELVEFYGPDVLLLIGGELHRDGDPRRGAAQFRAAVEAA